MDTKLTPKKFSKRIYRRNCLFLLFLYHLLVPGSVAQDIPEKMLPDVRSYEVFLEPEIQEKSLKGKVIINFLVKEIQQEVIFSCGDLIIDSVSGKTVESFRPIYRMRFDFFISEEMKEWKSNA